MVARTLATCGPDKTAAMIPALRLCCVRFFFNFLAAGGYVLFISGAQGPGGPPVYPSIADLLTTFSSGYTSRDTSSG